MRGWASRAGWESWKAWESTDSQPLHGTKIRRVSFLRRVRAWCFALRAPYRAPYRTPYFVLVSWLPSAVMVVSAGIPRA